MALYNKTASDRLEDHYRNNTDVHYFLRKFEASASISNQRYRRYKRIDYTDWIAHGSPIPTTTETEDEPMIDMTIPQHKFRDLIEREEYLSRLEQDYDYNQKIVNMLRADERVRDDNPAVAKAYRNYLTLLELARK